MDKISDRLTAIESDKADVLEAEAELAMAVEIIEDTEREYAKRKQQAFGRIAKLEEFMAEHDPEWAFTDYDKTALQLSKIALESAEQVKKLEAEIVRLRAELQD